MNEKSKKPDKPNDPPYAGGEDETVQAERSNAKEPPVDESDDSPPG